MCERRSTTPSADASTPPVQEGKILFFSSSPRRGACGSRRGGVAVAHVVSPWQCHASIVKLHNHPVLVYRRRELRASLTPAEAKLWKHLQRRQLIGWKFSRQHSVGGFVLDFYCPDARLAVEVPPAAHMIRSLRKRATAVATTFWRSAEFASCDSRTATCSRTSRACLAKSGARWKRAILPLLS